MTDKLIWALWALAVMLAMALLMLPNAILSGWL